MKADLLLKNAYLVNVFTSEIYKSDIYIKDGIIIGFSGDYDADETICLDGKFITPAFIEGHIHLESTHILPKYFVDVAIKNGIAAFVCDPHEIANVAGIDGIEFLLEETKNLPIDFFFMAPSCVPASPVESSGASLRAKELASLLKYERIIGLGEVMNYPAVIGEDKEILEKIKLFSNKIIDGHAPGLQNEELDSYIRHGIMSDHEASKKDEALEKIRKGMMLMIREGSSAKNGDLFEIINERNDNRFMFVSDDNSPADMFANNYMLKRMRMLIDEYGIDLLSFIKGVTINPATYFRLAKRGAIAPGYVADLNIFDSLDDLNLVMMIKNGKKLFKIGDETYENRKVEVKKTFSIREFSPSDFAIKKKSEKVKVIQLFDGSLFTKKEETVLPFDNGYYNVDLENDIVKIALVERYSGKSNYSVGFLKGSGLKNGALASSYNHDSHNVMVIGVSDEMMAKAINRLKELNGGIVYFDGENYFELPFPIYGIISDLSLNEVSEKYCEIEELLKKNGVGLKNPLTTFSFMALSVIPEIKINDKGVVENLKVGDIYV